MNLIKELHAINTSAACETDDNIEPVNLNGYRLIINTCPKVSVNIGEYIVTLDIAERPVHATHNCQAPNPQILEGIVHSFAQESGFYLEPVEFLAYVQEYCESYQ